MRYRTFYAKLPIQVFVCVFRSLALAPPTLHNWPLPLSAGWLPRLQCRLSSSCCYETRTDRPELNDNVSVTLAGGPQQPIRDGLDATLPNLGSGDLRGGLFGLAGASSAIWGASLLTLFISSAIVSMRKCVSHRVLNDYESFFTEKNVAPKKGRFVIQGEIIVMRWYSDG